MEEILSISKSILRLLGENEREVGWLRRNRGKQEKRDDACYSLNEGVSISGHLANVDYWVQGKLKSNLFCDECGKY